MLKFISSKMFIMPILYILSGIIIYLLIAKLIKQVSKLDIKQNKGIDKRKITIINLIKNIIKYIIAIIVIIMILNLYGINTTSIIASLGVASLVIGLAFQDIIKDFLAGIFIIFDNEYAVGDTVEINGFKGEVISLGLKTTKIKAYTGEVKALSNSSFTEVINYSLNHSNILMYIPISYETKIEEVETILNDLIPEIKKNKNVYEVTLLGIDSFDDSCIKYAIILECVEMTQYGVKREVLKLIKNKFDEENIEIPYNKLDVHIEK